MAGNVNKGIEQRTLLINPTCNTVSCSAGVRGVRNAWAVAGVTEYSLKRAFDAMVLSSTDKRADSLAWPIFTI